MFELVFTAAEVKVSKNKQCMHIVRFVSTCDACKESAWFSVVCEAGLLSKQLLLSFSAFMVMQPSL